MDRVTTDEVVSVAEGLLDLFVARGVEYIFGNAGTDFPPLIEAIARARHLGRPVPQPVVVPHENVAMAMAHGNYMVTGRLQAVMVHVGLGTANALNGIYNAARLNIPILLAAGRTPVTESGVFGGRNNYINWAQEMFDQAGMLRELVKWEYELRHPAQLEMVVDRAMAVAQSSPPGPVYLTLPREVLAAGRAKAQTPDSPVMTPVTKPEPCAKAVERLAELIATAKRPVIVTSAAGHSEDVWPALAQLAERFAIPVVQYRPRYMALPTDHPMHCGYNPTPFVKQADLVIVLESDVPWIPDEVGPITATVVQVGLDPLFQRYPMRSFAADIAIMSDTATLLERLIDVLPHEGDTRLVEARRLEIAHQRRSSGVASQFPEGRAPAQMTPRWVTACINAAKDDETILINEYPFVLEELTIDRPGTFFAHSPAGGLGWAMGAALGAKLGRPSATVIAGIGDGTYMFGNPTPTHMVSRALGLPVLFVIFNNRRWGAVHRATLSMYPQGYAAQEAEPPFATLEPSPDFEQIVTASGGYGERVDDPAELPAALQRALRAVREEGRQAVLNVICEAVYARTS
ncbi:acetolactate synthase-1/2/3 large subunit [Microvirga flocculans]|uniref:Acetolactate synthase-1/2/3 large subunit n=1 Tax=Microvirga flocculans TaxID=217168 RepID=A0A7W6IGQ9_9HYPH|nr:thiamine pyrophosphate-requiring protein [Microvirga flocculans]MBB4041168.1 acetolactate synthase-1/2/3 large subunit [Microvirga flocculans]